MANKRKPPASRRAAGRAANLDPGRWLEEHRPRIAEAAYYRAQQRGFVPGGEEEDWLWAEQQIRSEQRARSR